MYRRLLLAFLMLAGLSSADLGWTFSTVDERPGAVGGIYGYVYPSATSPGQTGKHTAALKFGGTDVNPNARLDFSLDGGNFPGAGFGLMFDNAASIDMRNLDSVQVWVRSDRSRKIRLSLAPSDSALKRAADTGVSFGRDTTIGTEWVRWVIRAEDLAWPKWAADAPSVRREELLSRIFALQFDVGCEAKSGSCSQEVGFIEVDDVELIGAGGRWNDPETGDCSGDTLWIDRFRSGNSRQNDLGGWWYAYTDRTSADTSARGTSKVMNATNPDSADTWSGPGIDTGAMLAFQLNRWKVYSGYAAIETQLVSPDAESRPQARSFPGARAISFRTHFATSFPDAMGGILVHLRKKGRSFENGRDHQLQIPVDTVDRHWCIDLEDFQQPTWSEWIESFTTDSLLALSFEVRLPFSLDNATSSFRISEIAFHGDLPSGVARRAFRGTGKLSRTPGGWTYSRTTGIDAESPWMLLDASGRRVDAGVLASGQASLVVGAWHVGLAFLVVGADAGDRETFKLLLP